MRPDGAEGASDRSTCLRPIREDSVDPMTKLRSTTRFFAAMPVLKVFAIALIVALMLAFADNASAHTMKPTQCASAWQAAPSGHRWQVKQKCLARATIHNCRAHVTPVARTVRVKGVRIDRNQRKVLTWIVHEAKLRRLPPVYAVAAIAATTQEASARELTYGHGTSLGPFQLISSHGTAAQRISVEFSGNWFYNGARKVYRRGMTPGQLAQAVQRSAHPAAYNQWVPEARRTLAAGLSGCRLPR